MAILKDSRECASFMTLGNLFQILGVMKKECLNSSVLAGFSLYFLLASRVRGSALSRYPVSLIHTRSFLILYSTVNLLIFLLFSKDDMYRSLSICVTLLS